MSMPRINPEMPRIVIYGPGFYGKHLVHLAHSKGWPIVAAFNRAGDKVGRDLGRVAEMGEDIGVIVEDCDTADFSKLEADVAFVIINDRLEECQDAHNRLLDAGINVITHCSEAYLPYSINRELAEELDQLARRNKVTFTGTGIWDMSRIWAGILLAGSCAEINGLYHKTLSDLSRASVTILENAFGVGLTRQEFEEQVVNQPGRIGGLYKIIPEQVLTALGYSPTGNSEKREPIVLDEPIYCQPMDKEIPAGLCIGMRITSTVTTAEGVIGEAEMEVRLCKPGEIEIMQWTVDGTPESAITTRREDSVLASAVCMFNRAKDVIAAPPGIQEVHKLGPMKHTAI